MEPVAGFSLWVPPPTVGVINLTVGGVGKTAVFRPQAHRPAQGNDSQASGIPGPVHELDLLLAAAYVSDAQYNRNIPFETSPQAIRGTKTKDLAQDNENHFIPSGLSASAPKAVNASFLAAVDQAGGLSPCPEEHQVTTLLFL
ncbi:hypothetical protein MC885_000136 [Smutsia gigantea]|nr:hypothetical protein MC885_000136 [Smutsia gigantea]